VNGLSYSVLENEAGLVQNSGSETADRDRVDSDSADSDSADLDSSTAEAATDDDPDAEPEEVGANGTRPKVGALRAKSATSGAASSRTSKSASQYDGMPTSQLKTLMKRLDDRERSLSLFAAPLGIGVAILVTLVSIHANPALHHKGHESPSIIWSDGAVGMALAVAVFALGWFRRRSLTSLALVFLGYSLGLIGIGIPFLFLGGYFFFRAWRVQKVLTARGVDPRPRAQSRSKDRSSVREQNRDSRSARSTTTARKTAKTTSSRPQQSKRYTPPKPPAKRPPPSKPEQEDRTPRASIFDRQRNSERSSNG